MSFRRWMFPGLVAALMFGLAPAARAQFHDYDMPANDFPDGKQDAAKKPDRKEPGIFFHRPKMDSPAAQLALADRLRAEGRRERAMSAYLALVHRWHQAPEAATAQFRFAALLQEKGKFEKAFKEYQYLITFFAGAFPYQQVLDEQFAIANHVRTEPVRMFLFIRAAPNPERALPLLDQLAKNAPGWERTPEVLFTAGEIQEKDKNYPEARDRYTKLCFSYPTSPLAETAAFRRALCARDHADRNSRDEGLRLEAIRALSLFIARYRDSQYLAEARAALDALKDRQEKSAFERAAFYEVRARQPLAALSAYRDFVRRFPNSALAADARNRIEALERLTPKGDAR